MRFLFLSILFGFIPVAVSADGDYLPYHPEGTVQQQYDATLTAARTSGKMALFAVGANWCHDSRAMAQRILSGDMQQEIAALYEVAFVDVGFYERVQEAVEPFGAPVIYGTPTVFIVDPESGEVLNRETAHVWRDVSMFDNDQVRQYLAARDDEKVAATVPEAIHAFEVRQAKRIYEGFRLIGPMLAVDQADRPDTFMSLWRELGKFRYAFTDDLKKLRQDAAAGKEIEFPTYHKFSWEK